jgi:hypothetical protein
MMFLLLDHGVDAAQQRGIARDLMAPPQWQEQALHQIGLEHHDVFVDAHAEELIVAQPMLAMQALVERRVIELGVCLRHERLVQIDGLERTHLHAACRIGREPLDGCGIEPAGHDGSTRMMGRQPLWPCRA